MTEPSINPLSGPNIPLPQDMEALPDDLTIIARLIDANCRAHSEAYGFHLDSRCLTHYNEGIVRLAQAGMVDLMPVIDDEGQPTATLYEEVVDAPAQAMRVRANYVLPEARVTRPTTDPRWEIWQRENVSLREENARLRAEAKMPPPVAPPDDPDSPKMTPNRAP